MKERQIISKELLKDHILMASILKAVVPEYKDVSEYDIAFKYIEPESICDDTEISENEYGLIFEAKSKERKIQIELKFDIKVQNDCGPGLMSRRAVFDGAKMLDTQVDKVCTIWICMNPPQDVSNTIVRFKIKKSDLFGTADTPNDDCDLLESVIISLGNEGNKPNIKIFNLLYAIFGNGSKENRLGTLRDLGYADTSLETIFRKCYLFRESIGG